MVTQSFQATGKTIDFAGYLRAYVEGADDPEAELADRETILPSVQVGEQLDLRQLDPKSHTTQPPNRFNEASLVKELEERGIGLDYADLYREGAAVPDPATYDGVIFLGGPMSANDPLPFLDQERAVIAGIVERGQPLLGVCLGSQLIARVLGADVHRNAEKEIGWFDIHFTEAAAEDRFRGPARSAGAHARRGRVGRRRGTQAQEADPPARERR